MALAPDFDEDELGASMVDYWPSRFAEIDEEIAEINERLAGIDARRRIVTSLRRRMRTLTRPYVCIKDIELSRVPRRGVVPAGIGN